MRFHAGGIASSHFRSASLASFCSFSPSSYSFLGPGTFLSSNHFRKGSKSTRGASLFQRLQQISLAWWFVLNDVSPLA